MNLFKTNAPNGLQVAYYEKVVGNNPTYSLAVPKMPIYIYICYKSAIDYPAIMMYNPKVNEKPLCMRRYNSIYKFTDEYCSFTYSNGQITFKFTGYDAGTHCITMFY